MRKLLFFAFLALSVAPAFCQKEQDSDTLGRNGKRYRIVVDRNMPSILSMYYQRTDAQSPFNFWSTSNNRGHVAVFEELNNAIYLSRVEAKRFKTRMGNLWTETGIDTVTTPDYFHIAPVDSLNAFRPDLVKADWFSGVIMTMLIPSDKKEAKTDEGRGVRFMKIVRGEIVDETLYSLDQISAIELGDTKKLAGVDARLYNEYKALQRFYSVSLSNREGIVYKGHEGLLERKDHKLTLVMEAFGNDPYAWAAASGTGMAGLYVPLASWQLRADSLIMTSLWKEKDRSQLSPSELGHIEVVTPPADSGQSGDYVVHYGSWDCTNPEAISYTVYKTQKLRIKDGIVMSSEFAPSGFDEDQQSPVAENFTVCNEDALFSVDDKQLAEVVGSFRQPKQNPKYKGEKGGLRAWFQNRPLTDERAKDRLFRVRVGFVVNCEGKAGRFKVISKGKGELYEFADMVLEIVKDMPQI